MFTKESLTTTKYYNLVQRMKRPGCLCEKWHIKKKEWICWFWPLVLEWVSYQISPSRFRCEKTPLPLTASSSWFRARKRSLWLEMIESRESTWPSGIWVLADDGWPGKQTVVRDGEDGDGDEGQTHGVLTNTFCLQDVLQTRLGSEKDLWPGKMDSATSLAD